MNKSLAGKKILITGGSSRLGRAFVEKASGQGAEVFYTFFRHGNEVGKLPEQRAKGFALDLTDMRAIDDFIEGIKAEARSLDVLIHNAAAVRDRTIANMTEAEWDEVLMADLKAPYYLTKKALPLLFAAAKEQKMSKIFFITSRVALKGSFGVSNYAAAKAGLIGLTKSLAAELGKKKILVNAVNPGFMKSRMTERLPGEVIQKNLEESPLGTYSEPDEVADFLSYLCSDKMAQVSGQVLHYEARRI